RAFVDVQRPPDLPEQRLMKIVEEISTAIRMQHSAVIVTPPEIMGMRTAGAVDEGGWQFLRVKFRIWPNQTPIIETHLRQRLVSAIRAEGVEYPDWMIAVTLRAG